MLINNLSGLNFNLESKEIASEAYKLGETEIVTELQPEIKNMMLQMLQRIRNYKTAFEIVYKNWIVETEQDELLTTAISKDFERGKKIPVLKKDLNNSAAEDLAFVMLQGLDLLTSIRYQLTGTKIETVFYIQDNDGNIKRITNAGAMKPTLSLYSASGTLSNPINLAYSIQQDFIQGQEILEDEGFDIAHYISLIDRAKEKYLADKSTKNINRNYSAYYDSKDMEILELLVQRKAKSLSWTNYASYREKFGNAGKQTTAIEMGDIGNIQVKFFGKNQKQTNALRFSLLRNKINELEEIFALNNTSIQYQKLKDIFIPNTTSLHDELSKEVNRTALNNLKRLFNL